MWLHLIKQLSLKNLPCVALVQEPLTKLEPLWNICGTLKNTVYATKPKTQEKLKDMICHTINDIQLSIIQTVYRLFRVVFESVLWQKVDF